MAALDRPVAIRPSTSRSRGVSSRKAGGSGGGGLGGAGREGPERCARGGREPGKGGGGGGGGVGGGAPPRGHSRPEDGLAGGDCADRPDHVRRRRALEHVTQRPGSHRG